MNILESLDIGTIRTTKLKSGEELVGVTYNIDEDSIYIEHPRNIVTDESNFYLSDWLYFTNTNGIVVDLHDCYYSEQSSVYIVNYYLESVKEPL